MTTAHALLSSRVPSFRRTADGEISSPNTALLSLLGYSAEAFADSGPRTVQQLISGEQTPSSTVTLVGAAGNPIPVRLIEMPEGDSGAATWLCFAIGESVDKALIDFLLSRDDEDKARMARRLHDTTAQNLAALSMNLSMLDGMQLGENAQHLLDECLALTRECLSEVRSLSYSIQPPLLGELGLVSALRSYVDAYGKRTDASIDLRISADFSRLPGETEARLFAILQERLSWLERTRKPVRCVLELGVEDGESFILLSDDAICPPSEALSLSYAVIQERARLAGARLTITARPRGTEIRVIIARS